MRFLLLIMPLLFVGCGGVQHLALMQHPQTGDVRECKIDPWGDIRYAKQIDDCVKLYEKVGYEKVQ